MSRIEIKSPEHLGRHFVAAEYLPAGADEYYLRNEQTAAWNRPWRPLTAGEVEKLVQNGNTADNWDTLLVTDEFDPSLVLNSRFYGLVRIGRLRNVILEHHDLRLPCGITDSLIAACDIGDDVAIHNVRYLAHYLIGDRCLLANIDEMHTTDHAKFGNGILKDGEDESVRVRLDIINETGSRGVMPFDGMLPADAWLWARYRDNIPLMDAFKTITQNRFDSRRGYYGTVGCECVIKNCRILKDVKVGPHAYIKGANKLKNLTINSSENDPTQIGEGVEIVNGIIGCGCSIFYGVKAIRFVLGENSSLKYGARLINSYLGDNSTISCCEVLNNLIFPAHEQHHNNSFLIAALVMGQSNMAAGATIGSNHNSRANDNELQAGRGFWPGLCTSVKHPCNFASYVLLSKGDYPAELNIPLPFALLNNNVAQDRLEIIPAFWWLYNMYALARNAWKFRKRDTRFSKLQNIEFDALAPDTIEEIFLARTLLEQWTGKAMLGGGSSTRSLQAEGRKRLAEASGAADNLEIVADSLEKSNRKTVILKTQAAWRAYGDMIHYYAVKNLIAWMQFHVTATFTDMKQALKGSRQTNWVNLGGQLVLQNDLETLLEDITGGRLADWDAIHQRYDDLWKTYQLQKQQHAYASLCDLLGTDDLTADSWQQALNRAVQIQQDICNGVYQSRKKDYDNPFAQANFRNEAEMTAVLGTPDDNSFVKQIEQETDRFKQAVETLRQR